MKQLKKMLTCVALAIGLATISAHAGLQTQTSTNILSAASTNTFALFGDATGSFTNGEVITGPNQFIDGTKAQDLYAAVGGFFTNSTPAPTNIIYHIAQSVGQSVWTNNAFTVVLIVPGNTTNWVEQQFRIAGAYPQYGLRDVWNTNLAAVSGRSLYFRAFSKNGL